MKITAQQWPGRLLIAVPLTLCMGLAQAQFNRPPDSFQSVTVTAEGQTQTDGSTGAGTTPTSASASVIRGGPGEPAVASAFAGTTLGPGSVSGSIGTAFAGPATASASAEAYFGDGLTITANTSDAFARIYFSVALWGTSETFLDSSALPPGTNGTAGDLNSLFVMGIDDHFASWETKKTLRYDGGTTLERFYNNGGPDDRTYGVFEFSAQIPLGQEVPLDLYMLLTSDMNVGGLSTNGAAYTDESPGLFWNGISKVTTMDGSLLSYSVSSRTGVNYLLSAAPMVTPEPATWILAMLGLAPLVVWRRRALRAAAAGARREVQAA